MTLATEMVTAGIASNSNEGSARFERCRLDSSFKACMRMVAISRIPRFPVKRPIYLYRHRLRPRVVYPPEC